MAHSLSALRWLHEPKSFKVTEGKLEVQAESRTDFWQVTHYGFVRNNGHFYFKETSGDFLVKVKVSGEYAELYDQAGLMIRLDDKTWIKTGIEFLHGKQNISAVVTRDFSDWSVVPRSDSPASIWLTLLRKGDFVEIKYSLDNERFKMLRLAYFPPDVPLQVGVMCAAPTGDGFTVRFEDFSIEPAL